MVIVCFRLYVYSATFQLTVILPCLFLRYPQYEVYGDVDGAKTGQLNARYSLSSLFNVAADIQLLAESDYLVCTFSSQVRMCDPYRLAWQ